MTTQIPDAFTDADIDALSTLGVAPRLAAERLRYLERRVCELERVAPPTVDGMWRALAQYQATADEDGHGDTWRRMCAERTKAAARCASFDAALKNDPERDRTVEAVEAADAAAAVAGRLEDECLFQLFDQAALASSDIYMAMARIRLAQEAQP